MKQLTRTVFTLTTALAMLSCTVLPMSAAAEGEDIAAQIQAASDANAAYDVTISPFTVNAANPGSRTITYSIGSGLFGVEYDDYVFTDPEDPTHQAAGTAFAVVDRNGDTVLPLMDVGTDFGRGLYYAENGILSLCNSVFSTGMQIHDPALIRKLYPDMEFTDEDTVYGRVEYYDLEGNVLFEHEPYTCGSAMTDYAWVGLTDTESEGQLRVKEYRIIDQKGETVAVINDEIAEKFREGDAGIGAFFYGLAYYDVLDEERSTEDDYYYLCGFMDTQGNIVIEPQYDSVSAFFNNRAVVTDRNGMTGLIDTTGKYVIEPIYDNIWVSEVSPYYLAQDHDGLWTVIDRDGTPLSEPKAFEVISGFNENYAIVQTEEGVGYIDHTGNPVIPCEYEFAFNHNEELFSVKKDGKYGVIDKNNNVVVPLVFDDISAVDDNAAIALSGSDLYVLHINAAEETAPQPTVLGDVNGDDIVNAADATNILIAAAEIGSGNAPALGEVQLKTADIDGSGVINAADASIALQYAAAIGAGYADAKLEDFIGA